MGISNKTRMQLQQVKDYIESFNITQIHTRGVLDRMIEKIKFPETCLGYNNERKTLYKNQQYDKIRRRLVNSGFLSQSFDGKCYHYTVNK